MGVVACAVNFVSEYEQSYFHQHLFARERERERDRDRDGGKAGDRQSHYYMPCDRHGFEIRTCILFSGPRGEAKSRAKGPQWHWWIFALESALLP